MGREPVIRARRSALSLDKWEGLVFFLEKTPHIVYALITKYMWLAVYPLYCHGILIILFPEQMQQCALMYHNVLGWDPKPQF